MAQIPRQQLISQVMIQRLIFKLLSDIQADFIPMSTGVYSYEKLQEKLKAIPGVETISYNDPLFLQMPQPKKDVHPPSCQSCGKQFSFRKKAISCAFCLAWKCDECISLRKRMHPRQKQPNGVRYDCCKICDQKFLLLQINHGYCQNKRLFDTVIQYLAHKCDELTLEIAQRKEKQFSERNKPKIKNSMIISGLKRQNSQLNKRIAKLQSQILNQKEVSSKSQVRLEELRKIKRDREQQKRRKAQQAFSQYKKSILESNQANRKQIQVSQEEDPLEIQSISDELSQKKRQKQTDLYSDDSQEQRQEQKQPQESNFDEPKFYDDLVGQSNTPSQVQSITNEHELQIQIKESSTEKDLNSYGYISYQKSNFASEQGSKDDRLFNFQQRQNFSSDPQNDQNEEFRNEIDQLNKHYSQEDQSSLGNLFQKTKQNIVDKKYQSSESSSQQSQETKKRNGKFPYFKQQQPPTQITAAQQLDDDKQSENDKIQKLRKQIESVDHSTTDMKVAKQSVIRESKNHATWEDTKEQDLPYVDNQNKCTCSII